MRLRGILLSMALTAALVSTARADEVRAYSAPLTIPTYQIGAPEQMPAFGRMVYPYPMYDKLTDNRVQKQYNALWVENEYVKALVLPEIGGRLHGAQDKTNGYQFLYDQTTIKPGLVGMTGAWISGGVEWNFPHGHRPSGFRETDWTIQENPDGSRTAWTGEIDQVYGMRWSVGTTVYPGRNWVETKVRLYNSTPYTHSFQYWATSAVRITDNYQAVIPGEIVTGHQKHEFWRWPVSEGVDISYWKNIPPATSYFAWESKSDYFGGYSPEFKGGMVHFADHNIVRGKKLWTWGTAPSGRIWEKILTDGDSAYFEPQAGAYSDNQPDYHWILPGETKVFSHYWFPVRDIGVYDFANLEGALNIELNKGKVRIGWSPTGKNTGAKVTLSAKGGEIYSSTVNADPATPFITELKAPKGVELYDLTMTVVAANGETLLSFTHPRPTNPPLPDPMPRDPKPEDVKSLDELFTIGDRVEKFREVEKALEYYEEAVRRDPGDVRTNTALGLIDLKNGKSEEALARFEKALERDPAFYKAWYYKGMAQMLLGRCGDAEFSLNRASYDFTWYAAAQFELAQLTLRQGYAEKALEHIERAIRGNGDNVQALAVKAVALNRLGRNEEALKLAGEVQKTDPLDLLSLAAKGLAARDMGRGSEAEEVRDQALKILRGDPQNYIELAIRLGRCGLYDLADMVLSAAVESGSGNALVLYHQAWFSHLSGNESRAASLLGQAAKAASRNVFPNRLEDLAVIKWALEKNGSDALAWYFLGNLYYNFSRTDEAGNAWEKAVSLDAGNAVAWRNLGFALNLKKNYEKSAAAYAAAIKADPTSGQALYEYDAVNKKLNKNMDERLAMLEANMKAIADSDPALTQLISLYVQKGRYEDALKYLSTHHFHSWEGRYGIHQYWVESNIMKGDAAFAKGDFKNALAAYQAAMEYPENLEVAAQPRVINARKQYKIAEALEALGRKGEARKQLQAVVDSKPRPDDAQQYFRGLALDKLGKKAESHKVFEDFLAAVNKAPETNEHQIADGINFDPDRRAEAIQSYKLSLAYEGLGDKQKAGSERAKALEMDPIVQLRAFSPPRAGW